jgi:hypothetical protein
MCYCDYAYLSTNRTTPSTQQSAASTFLARRLFQEVAIFPLLATAAVESFWSFFARLMTRDQGRMMQIFLKGWEL